VLLFPFPRDLSPMPHQLMILAHFVSFLRPQGVTSTIRLVELGITQTLPRHSCSASARILRPS